MADTLPHGCATDRSHHPKINTERYSSQFYYRPQGSCGKVMFSQASVILSTGGVADSPLGRHPHLQADTPPSGQTPPWADNPLGRNPPCPVHAGIHSPAQCMLGYTPPLPSACWNTPPPQKWLLQRTVRILLECILVAGIYIDIRKDKNPREHSTLKGRTKPLLTTKYRNIKFRVTSCTNHKYLALRHPLVLQLWLANKTKLSHWRMSCMIKIAKFTLDLYDCLYLLNHNKLNPCSCKYCTLNACGGHI